MTTQTPEQKAQYIALTTGRHADPFALLGPHREGDSTVVRTFQPQAENVWLLAQDGARLAKMEKIHRDGLYEATVPGAVSSYRLRVTVSGNSETIDDAYRFASLLGEIDLHLLGEGSHQKLYEMLGARLCAVEGVSGTYFSVWAPNAQRVSVVGNFNDWDGRRHVMRLHRSNGIWDIFVPDVAAGAYYKFELLDAQGNMLPLKTDPLAHYYEGPPGNASRVYQSHYQWSDKEWMDARSTSPDLEQAISIYEVHLGSWRRMGEDGGRALTYREHANALVKYVSDMGFTHIELMPVTEHPFDGSWGYQPIGMYAPTQRFGEPDDFRYFVDACHQAGLGVIIDWVPAHFPRDAHGLARFDGTALYEHDDPRRGEHRDWGTLIFNFGRREVSNYLIANALYWIDEFHIDALRVDAVASMIYLDYSREAGEWLPNEQGGNENLEAVAFLRRLNELVHAHGAITFAEESTSWPGVSHPVYSGGLGFTYKWNMGWMNDTLRYMSEDPVHRSFHHDLLTFGLVYAFHENFVLPLSHDEVVHGKRSLLGRMPGDEWQKFANLRTYYGFMFGQPGKKLLFMGAEFAQSSEWNHDQSLDWHLLEYDLHAGVAALVRDLNFLYTAEPALHQVDFEGSGFEWIDWQDRNASVIAWMRRARNGEHVVFISNFTPIVRHSYDVGVPQVGTYKTLLNTDDKKYGGSDIQNPEHLEAREHSCHGRPASITLTLPPLSTLVLKPVT
ncbi:MAG: 1,4-alpha-glucan branching protein GlgB [Gammaproteobacteria bacterium]|nr:1,4-alpha-glucan branching protein GlgB [Gammaproteobacteria bacterium]